jgi:hypothetical protein
MTRVSSRQVLSIEELRPDIELGCTTPTGVMATIARRRSFGKGGDGILIEAAPQAGLRPCSVSFLL